jgi:hypothetical protein
MKFKPILIGVLTILFALDFHFCGGRPLEEAPPIEFRIITSRTLLHGTRDKAEIKLEFFNRGKRDIYVGGEIAGFQSAPSKVFIRIEDKTHNVTNCGLMNLILSQKAVDDWWTKIAPFHYYGTKFELDSQICEAFKVPGEYRLTAVYISKGGQVAGTSSTNSHAEEAWSGQIESNEIRIRFTME